LGGMEGRVEGILADTPWRTAQGYRNDLIKIRNLRVRKLYLTVGDYTLQVVVQNIACTPMPRPRPAFAVGFDFYQQDSINTIIGS
jgi:hypothetical protein